MPPTQSTALTRHASIHVNPIPSRPDQADLLKDLTAFVSNHACVHLYLKAGSQHGKVHCLPQDVHFCSFLTCRPTYVCKLADPWSSLTQETPFLIGLSPPGSGNCQPPVERTAPVHHAWVCRMGSG